MKRFEFTSTKECMWLESDVGTVQDCTKVTQHYSCICRCGSSLCTI